MVHFIETARADVQLHFLYALIQVALYCGYFWSWRSLHFLLTIRRLQCNCVGQRSVMEFLYNIDVVCSHSLPHAADIWWRQFGWTLLHDQELSKLPHHSHLQAFHLSTIDQLLWRHHPSLHQGSYGRVADHFLSMKNDCMQIKTKQFDFYKIYFRKTFPRNCIVQIKKKLFRLVISWTKTILQKFWKGNRIFIKEKWRE